jgi:hypothetical protein
MPPGEKERLHVLEWSEAVSRCSMEKKRLKRMAQWANTSKMYLLTLGVWPI